MRSVNALYLRLCHRLQAECPVPVELAGAVELDELYISPRRVRGKHERGDGSKTVVFCLFKWGDQVYTELSLLFRSRPYKPL